MTQNQMVLEALQQGRRITPIDALNEFGCLRLAARINDLKGKGHNIIADTIVLPSGKQVAQYRMEITESPNFLASKA